MLSEDCIALYCFFLGGHGVDNGADSGLYSNLPDMIFEFEAIKSLCLFFFNYPTGQSALF